MILVGRLCDLAFRRRAAPVWSTEEKLLWLWAAIVIGFFSVARFKLDHYIFPAAPALCLIAARAWQDAALGDRGRAPLTRAAVCMLGAGLVVAGTFTSVYLFELDLELPDLAIVLPMVLALGGVALLTAVAKAGWRVPATPLVPAVTLLALFAIVVTIGFPTLEHTKPTALIARTLHRKAPADAPAANLPDGAVAREPSLLRPAPAGGALDAGGARGVRRAEAARLRVHEPSRLPRGQGERAPALRSVPVPRRRGHHQRPGRVAPPEMGRADRRQERAAAALMAAVEFTMG